MENFVKFAILLRQKRKAAFVIERPEKEDESQRLLPLWPFRPFLRRLGSFFSVIKLFGLHQGLLSSIKGLIKKHLLGPTKKSSDNSFLAFFYRQENLRKAGNFRTFFIHKLAFFFLSW